MSASVKRAFAEDDNDQRSSKHQKKDERTRIKFLVPIYTAGAIIGAKGSEINKLKQETETQVHLSEAQEYFPGTRERVVVVTGMEHSVIEVFRRVNTKLRNEDIPENVKQKNADRAEKRRTVMKCLVPTAIAGKIVGKGGEAVKKLQEEYKVKIDVTPSHKAIQGLDERNVDITGDEEQVNSAGVAIVKMLSEEPDTRLSSSLIYSRYSNGSNDQFNGGNYGTTPFNRNTGGYNQRGGYNQGPPAPQGNYGNYNQSYGYGGPGGYQGSYPGGYQSGYNPGYYGDQNGYGGYGQQPGYQGYPPNNPYPAAPAQGSWNNYQNPGYNSTTGGNTGSTGNTSNNRRGGRNGSRGRN